MLLFTMIIFAWASERGNAGTQCAGNTQNAGENAGENAREEGRRGSTPSTNNNNKHLFDNQEAKDQSCKLLLFHVHVKLSLVSLCTLAQLYPQYDFNSSSLSHLRIE